MDLQILNWVHDTFHGDKVLDFFAGVVTNSGNVGFVWILLSLVLLIFKKTRKTGFLMFASLALSYLIVDVTLKPLIGRARPFVVEPKFLDYLKTTAVSIPDSPSFPSGHSASSLATALALFLQNKKYGKFAMLYAVMVALSRIYFCVHFPTDVVCGAMIGMMSAMIVNLIYMSVSKRLAKKRGYVKLQDML